MAVLTLCVSPHYPWYFVWLAVPAVLAPNPAVLWLSAAPVLAYFGNYQQTLLWSSIIYVPALLLGLLSVSVSRRGTRLMPVQPINGA
jgi:alpha-1,6-mannosyltransferase